MVNARTNSLAHITIRFNLSHSNIYDNIIIHSSMKSKNMTPEKLWQMTQIKSVRTNYTACHSQLWQTSDRCIRLRLLSLLQSSHCHCKLKISDFVSPNKNIKNVDRMLLFSCPINIRHNFENKVMKEDYLVIKRFLLRHPLQKKVWFLFLCHARFQLAGTNFSLQVEERETLGGWKGEYYYLMYLYTEPKTHRSVIYYIGLKENWCHQFKFDILASSQRKS